MEKWWVYTFSCIGNAIAANIILLCFVFSPWLDGGSRFSSNEIIPIFIFLLIYFICIFLDIWGLKLFKEYNNPDSFSFSEKWRIQVLLFLLVPVQLLFGSITYSVMRQYVLNFTYSVNNAYTFDGIVTNLIVIVFFTSIVIFIGCILLLNAIKKKKSFIQGEIEKMG